MRFEKIKILLGGTKSVPPEEEVIERPKKPRAPRVRRTEESLSGAQWDQILNLECWDRWEIKKLRIMKGSYPQPVTSDQFRKEFGGHGLWVRSSFESINRKFRELILPYRVEGEHDGFQIFHVASIH